MESFFRCVWLNRLSNTVAKTTHGWLSVITVQPTVIYRPCSCKSAGAFEHVSPCHKWMNNAGVCHTFITYVLIDIRGDSISNKRIRAYIVVQKCLFGTSYYYSLPDPPQRTHFIYTFILSALIWSRAFWEYYVCMGKIFIFSNAVILYKWIKICICIH